MIERHVREYLPFEVYAKSLQEFFRGHEMTASEWELEPTPPFSSFVSSAPVIVASTLDPSSASDNQHRISRVIYHSFSHAAQNPALHARPAMRAHGYEIIWGMAA